MDKLFNNKLFRELRREDKIVIQDGKTRDQLYSVEIGKLGSYLSIQGITGSFGGGGSGSGLQQYIAQLIAIEFAKKFNVRANAVGILTQNVDGRVTEIPVRLFAPLRQGLSFFIQSDRREEPYNVTIGGEDDQVFSGEIILPLARPTVIDAPEGAPLIFSGIQLLSQLTIDPGRVQINVERIQDANAIGTLSENIISGSPTNYVSIKPQIDIDLKAGQELKIQKKDGLYESFIVNDDKSLISGIASLVEIIEKTFSEDYLGTLINSTTFIYESGANLSGRITVEAGRVNINAANITNQGNQIAGLDFDVTQNGTSIANIFSFVNYNGGSSFSNLELKAASDNNGTAISSLTSAVADIDADGKMVIRQSTAPTQRPSGKPLEVGDMWIDSSLDGGLNGNPSIPRDDLYVWNGSAWVIRTERLAVNQAGLINEVGKYKARSMIYAKTGGGLAFINVESDEEEGTDITMRADMIDANDWLFIKEAAGDDPNGKWLDKHGVLRSKSNKIVLNATTGVGYFSDIRITGGQIDPGAVLPGYIGSIKIYADIAERNADTDLYTGKVGYVVTNPNQLFRYNGSNWISTVDGEDILADSIVASKLDVAELSSINSATGNLSVTGQILLAVGGSIVGTKLNIDSNGKIIATDVDLTGKITATSGKFTGEVESTKFKATAFGYPIGNNYKMELTAFGASHSYAGAVHGKSDYHKSGSIAVSANYDIGISAPESVAHSALLQIVGRQADGGHNFGGVYLLTWARNSASGFFGTPIINTISSSPSTSWGSAPTVSVVMAGPFFSVPYIRITNSSSRFAVFSVYISTLNVQ